MRYGSVIGFLLTGFFMQTTLLNLVSVRGVCANLFLCLTIILILISREPLGTLGIATIIALIYDVCFSEYIGISSLAILLVGLFVYFISRILNIENIAAVLAVTAFTTIFYNTVLWAMYAVLGEKYNFIYIMGLQPFYILYNLAIAFGLYFIFAKYFKDRCRA